MLPQNNAIRPARLRNQPAPPILCMPILDREDRISSEFGGGPFVEFVGNSKIFARDFKRFAQKLGGNSGAKSAGAFAAV